MNNGFQVPPPPPGCERGMRLWPSPGPHLALAQRDGAHLLGELHEVSKLVQVSGRISSRGEDEDEGRGGGRLLKHHGQI